MSDVVRIGFVGWLHEKSLPRKVVFCTPSKSLETWLLVALFPQNRIAASKDVECRLNLETQLQAQPLATRLIRGGQKSVVKYRERSADVAATWDRVCQRCTEASRFSREFLDYIVCEKTRAPANPPKSQADQESPIRM